RRAVAQTPGVVTVAVSFSDLPPAAPFHASRVECRDGIAPPIAFVSEVSPQYFPALRMRFLRGRPWTELETTEAAHVAVVNRTMAERAWPGRNPLGQLMHLQDLKPSSAWALAAPGNDGWVEVIGVSADIPNNGLNGPTVPAVYVPYTL